MDELTLAEFLAIFDRPTDAKRFIRGADCFEAVALCALQAQHQYGRHT